MPSPILRQLDIANLFTISGLSASFISAILAIQGNFYGALIAMIYAGLSDMLDGVAARKIANRTPLQSEVGKQLDSIVDVCSFGFAPAIFAYCFGLNDWLAILLLLFFVSVNAMRLAYFNSTGLISDRKDEYFTGLPVTYAALFIPLFFTANFFVSATAMKYILEGVYLILAIAMVANFKMIKVKGIWYLIFGLGAVALILIYSWAIIQG